METAHALAARLAKGPREGFAKISRVLDASPSNSLEAQLELEQVTQGGLADHPNFREGVIAFLEEARSRGLQQAAPWPPPPLPNPTSCPSPGRTSVR